MPENDRSTAPDCIRIPPGPPAPQYNPAPHLVKSSLLTTEELISYYKDFYDSLKDSSCAPSLVFERLVSNLISSLIKPAPTDGPGHDNYLEKYRDENKALIDQLKAELMTAQTGLSTAQTDLAAARRKLAALGKCRDENKTLRLGMERLKAELATAQTDLATAKKELVVLGKCQGENKTLKLEVGQLKAELTTTKKELGKTQKELAKAQREFANIVETKPRIGDFHSSGGVSKDIFFSKPYSALPGVLVGAMSAYSKDRFIRATSYATKIRNHGFRIHNGSSDSPVISTTAHSSWLAVPPDDPDFRCGTISIQADDMKHEDSVLRQVTFTRPYDKPPKVVAYLSAFEAMGNSRFQGVKASGANITTTGFQLYISTSSSLRFRCTASWVSCSADMPNVLMGETSMDVTSPVSELKYTFHRGFTTPPRVLLAISYVYSPLRDNIQFAFGPPITDANGFRSDIQTNIPESEGCNIGISFIALG